MKVPPALLELSQKFGGPWKFLLMNLRGGQVQGVILTFSIFAWIISSLSGHDFNRMSTDVAVLVIAVYLTTYILACMLATHLYFGRLWLAYGTMVGDVIGIGASIAVAVLLHPSAANCDVQFMKVEGEILSMSHATKACSLQKVAFAANITNSLMFLCTIALQGYLMSKRHHVPKASNDEIGNDQIDIPPYVNRDPFPTNFEHIPKVQHASGAMETSSHSLAYSEG